MRGQFIRGDGLILPNNVSQAGAAMILRGAFRLTSQPIYAALVRGAPTLSMRMVSMSEPTIGVNGYNRVFIPQDENSWPQLGEFNSETFIRSMWLPFAAVGGSFDKPIQRIALVGSAIYNPTDPVFALSAPLEVPLVITPDTPLAYRRFRYQFYL